MNITLTTQEIERIIIRDLENRHHPVKFYGKLEIVNGAIVMVANTEKPNEDKEDKKEDKYDAVTKLVNVALPFIRKSEIINAIKAVRTETGCGLKEGKDWVEILRNNYLNAYNTSNYGMNTVKVPVRAINTW